MAPKLTEFIAGTLIELPNFIFPGRIYPLGGKLLMLLFLFISLFKLAELFFALVWFPLFSSRLSITIAFETAYGEVKVFLGSLFAEFP